MKVYEEIIKRGWGGKERKHFCRTETLVTKIALEVGRKRRGRERYYSIFIMQLKQVFFFIYSFTSKEAVNGKQTKKKNRKKSTQNYCSPKEKVMGIPERLFRNKWKYIRFTQMLRMINEGERGATPHSGSC